MATPASATGPTHLVVRGARQHNLKGFDVEFPRHALSVITGVSGSGKSSLAFDTIYAEGQRRYVESVSTYAKQFLERLPRPDVDVLHGLSPAVAIRQAAPAQGSRSTVATSTEIADYLRLLFARTGAVECPTCQRPLAADSPAVVAEEARRTWPEGTEVAVVAPVSLPPRLRWKDVVGGLTANGFVRVWSAGGATELAKARRPRRGEPLPLLVDRFRWRQERSARLAEACETAYERGEGSLWIVRDGKRRVHSEGFVCPVDGTTFPVVTPALFSFNSPYGACPTCRGFGDVLEFDEGRIVPDPTKTLREGAIDPWAGSWRRVFSGRLRELSRRTGIPLDVPWDQLSPAHRKLLLEGGEGFRGVRPFLERLKAKSYKAGNRFLVKRYQRAVRCRACRGTRLRHEADHVRVGGKTLPQIMARRVSEALAWAEDLAGSLGGEAAAVAAPLLEDILSRLRYLERVDLTYLTLDRATRTLSGGESQRIELATALGANLVDALYVLDEPTVGLHPRDTERLLAVLRDLRTRGNTVLVVEHDAQVVAAADWLVDLGPAAGEQGGELLYAGPPSGLRKTATGRFLSAQITVERRRPAGPPPAWLTLHGARHHNLRDLTIRLPLSRLTCVTGVSGSGKSSLVEETLYPALAKELGFLASDHEPGAYDRLEGAAALERVLLVDQAPIGRSPRSNPVTYVKAFDPIRALFAAAPLARQRGYKPGWFSFNVDGGRCDACKGDGSVRVEMYFLADLFVPCDVCGGARYKREVLEVEVRGYNVQALLERTVDQALDLFADHPEIVHRLRPLAQVGLGYLGLGQPATTLSGGESQRLKIARELGLGAAQRTLYLLDEPTVGLHPADVQVLLDVLSALVERGASVVLVEHNLDVIRNADWIVDLGPGGGEAGGAMVAEGPPAAVARETTSVLAPFLRESAPSLVRSETG